jgi:hypothetical protein
LYNVVLGNFNGFSLYGKTEKYRMTPNTSLIAN